MPSCLRWLVYPRAAGVSLTSKTAEFTKWSMERDLHANLRRSVGSTKETDRFGEYEGDRPMRGVKNITIKLASILQGQINVTETLFPDIGVLEVDSANREVEEICSSFITAERVAVYTLTGECAKK